ncbi:MAG: hypothetical protein IJ506_00180 [Clostridia bacterium]|nr:hypothetical protein [Clostridia bacterium]
MNYTQTVTPHNRAAFKRKIGNAHARAKAVGTLYFLATIALAVLAFFPMLSIGGVNLWVLSFWERFAALKNLQGVTFAVILDLAVAVFYALILLTVVCNVLRSFKKLGWLFKKKPSRSNGYNRNVYAMEDLGRLFSGSFHTILAFSFLIYLISKDATIALQPLYAYIALGVGFGVHFLGGLVGGGVSLFAIEGGAMHEERRRGSVWIPFLRNLVQIAIVAGIGYFLIKSGQILFLAETLRASEFTGILAKWKDLLVPAVFLVVYLWLLPLLKHATGLTEYDREGCEASGMKNFRIFTLLILLTSGATVVVEYIFAGAWLLQGVYIAGIALLGFIVEICLRKYPNDRDDSDEIESDTLLGGRYVGGVDFVPPVETENARTYEYYDD